MELVINLSGKVGKDDVIGVEIVDDCKFEICIESDMFVIKLKMMVVWVC